MFNNFKEEKGHGYFRKSKAYGLISGIALMGALALLSGVVSADEIETTVTDVVVVATNNLGSTVEVVQQGETVNQQAGEIVVVNASDDLNTAVATAQQEGVKVVPEEPKDYGVTTSVEETAAKQEEIQKDYASQAEVINKATEAYVEVKESYEKETSKIIEENNNLKAEHEAEVVKVDAENEAIRLRNSKVQEAYDKAMETYESDLAKYEVAVAEAQANTTKIGYASEVITQALLFDSEPNADYTVSGTVKLVKENDESRTYSLNKGETIVVTYTGLQNSTYDGIELSKVVYSYTAKSDNLNLYILKDPTLTVVLQPNNSATTSGESRVNLKAEFYDKDGNVIEFSEEKPAVISLSSLNRNSVYDGVGLGEAVAITSNNSEFVSINGSTISQNGNVISSSILDNHNRSLGSKYDANNDGVNVTDGNPNNYWDNEASPLRYYGAGLLKVTSGTSIEIDIFRNWENSEIAHTGDYYFGFNTKVGTLSEPIPTPSDKPTLKLEEELEYPKEPTYKELPEVPEVPTVSYRLAKFMISVKADVLVHYVDEDGNVIAETVKDTDQGSAGSAYDTTDHKPEYITVNGVRYKLMPKKTIGEETGILTEDGAEVTYVYHKIVTNWVEEGTNKVLKDREDGGHERGEIPDYNYVETVVDEETGDITHIFKQVSKPVETKTETPTVTPTVATKVVKQAAVTSLPNTGDSSGLTATLAGAMSTVFALLGFAKRKEN